MHSVNIKRTELLSKIKENRNNHVAEYKEAEAGYRIAVVDELKKMINDAECGRPVKRQLNLLEPQNHTKEYDRIIAMLEMSADDIIELDTTSFEQYVLDEWSWKELHKLSVANYNTRKY